MLEASTTLRPPFAARVRFAQLRRDVAFTGEEILTAENGFPISIREISDEAAASAQRWQYADVRSEHVPGWSWPDEVRRFRCRPRRVDAAFYAHDPDSVRLWGLVLGRISKSRVVASIHFLERDPDQERNSAFVAVASRYRGRRPLLRVCDQPTEPCADRLLQGSRFPAGAKQEESGGPP